MRFALEPDLEVVGEAGDIAEAIPLACALRPDVILMDVELPGVRGSAAIETLHTATPQSGMVIFNPPRRCRDAGEGPGGGRRGIRR